MRKENFQAILFIIFVFGVLGGCFFSIYSKEKDKKENKVFKNLYKLEIKNEHHVQCTSGRDTINLYFENAYNLAEERLVFIEH